MTKEEILKEYFHNDYYAEKLTGVELEEIGDGYARARLTIGPQHLNGAGIVQGGAIFTLADLVFAAASCSSGRVAVGLSSNINYIRPGNGKYLIAEAKRVNEGKTIFHGEIEVRNDQGKLVSTCTASAFRTDKQIF